MQWLSRLLHRPPNQPPFTPRNHLERLLVKAAVDPAVRPDFYRAFLDCSVFVIGWLGDQPPEEEDSRVAQEGEMLSIQHMEYEGRNVIPIFTSPERIAAYAPGTTYVGLLARELLDMTGAQELVLNPGSQYGKHFVADEIRGMLDGSLFAPAQTWKAAGGEEMLIGYPAKVPEKFIAALKGLFARRSEVRRAYLAILHIPSRNEQPNLLIAIDADGDLAPIVADCGVIAQATLEAGEFADFATTNIAADYFAKATPFYSRD